MFMAMLSRTPQTRQGAVGQTSMAGSAIGLPAGIHVAYVAAYDSNGG